MHTESTELSSSIVRWTDPARSGAPDERLARPPRVDADRRRDFFTNAGEETPFLGVEDESGATFVLGAGDGGEVRRFFAKRQAPSGRILRRVVQAVEANRSMRWNPTGAFVDAGADVGVATVVALGQLAFRSAVSIEANPARYRLLRANLVINDLDDRATAVNAALAAGSHPVALRRRKGWLDYRPVKDDVAEKLIGKGQAVGVRRTTIDDLVAEGTIVPAQVGLLWLGSREDPLEVLASAASLGSTVSTVIPFEADKLADEAWMRRAESTITSMFDKMIDVSGGDGSTAEPLDAQSFLERYRGSRRGTHILFSA